MTTITVKLPNFFYFSCWSLQVMLELEKLRQRVDEFNEYGELDMMGQYVQDIRAVQKRLADAQESISWLNKEEVSTIEYL